MRAFDDDLEKLGMFQEGGNKKKKKSTVGKKERLKNKSCCSKTFRIFFFKT